MYFIILLLLWVQIKHQSHYLLLIKNTVLNMGDARINHNTNHVDTMVAGSETPFYGWGDEAMLWVPSAKGALGARAGAFMVLLQDSPPCRHRVAMTRSRSHDVRRVCEPLLVVHDTSLRVSASLTRCISARIGATCSNCRRSSTAARRLRLVTKLSQQ